MAKHKEYKYGSDAREAIKTVATCIGDTLGKTLGPAGRNFQTPIGITNDGRSILEHIRFDDECEDNIALAFHEIANRQDKDAGDGTTTAVVIGTTLSLDLADKMPDLDTPTVGQESVMELSRRLEEEKNKVLELLKAKIIPVTTLEQVEQVAFTSMEDKEAAKIVAKTIFDAGAGSFTALEEGFSGKLETSVQPGIEMPITLNYGTNAECNDTPVLVANHLFEDYRELAPLLGDMVKFMNENKVNFKSLVIVGKQFSIPFMQKIATANQSSPFKIICLSNQYLSDDLFGDIAAFVDAQYVDTHPKGGKKITNVKFNQCGAAGKVVVNSKGTVFYNGKGNSLGEVTTRVQTRVLEIRSQLEKEKDTTKRTAMERRIAEFNGGKATIYVDAKTAPEKYYLKLKVEDCMNSCKSALEGGMVRGGGVSLKEVAEELGSDSLLYNALVAPYNRIQLNAGGTLEIGEGVMDSYLCVKAGIENAVSVIRVILTIEGIIADAVPDMWEEMRNKIAE